MFREKVLSILTRISVVTVLLILLPTAAQAVPDSPPPSLLQPASSGPPPGYEGALDNLRPVFPLWRPPLADPVGLALNAAGTRTYVIEKGLHRLSRVDIDPASSTYASVTPITDALDDPQMAVTLNAAETHAFVVENAPGTLKRVTLSNGQVTTVTTGLSYPLDLALSLDETTAYVTQFNGALVAVNLSSGGVTTVTTGLESPGGIALSPDGSTAYVAELRNEPLRQVDLSTGAISDVGTSEVNKATDLAVDATGSYAYLVESGARLVRVDLSSGDTEVIIPDIGHRAEAVALSPDGDTLYAAQRYWGRLLALDLTTGTGESVFPLLQEPSGLTLNQAGTRLYILEGASGELSVQDVDPASPTYGVLETAAVGVVPEGYTSAPTVNATETWALVPQQNDLRRVDLTTGAVSTVVSGVFNGGTGITLSGTATVVAAGLAGPCGAAVNAAGDTVYVAESGAGRLAAVDLGTGQVTTVTANLEGPLDVALDEPNNAAIVLETPYPNYHIARVDLTTGAVTRIFSGEYNTRENVLGLTLTPDHTRAYFAKIHAGEVWGVDLATGQIADSLVEGLSGPTGLALTGGGQGAYTTEEFVPRIRYVDLSTGQVSTTVHLPGPATGLALTQDESTAYVTRMYYDDLLKADLAAGTWVKVTETCMHGRIVLGPTETTAYVTCPRGGTIWAVDLANGSRTELVGGLSAPYALDINGAGTLLYTTAGSVGEPGDFQLLAVEVPTGTVTPVATIEEGPDAPGDITLSPDERHVYVYDQPPNISIGAGIWRVDVDPGSPTYGQVVALGRWMGELQHGEFTADGEHLILTNSLAHQIFSLYLGEYYQVYLPIIMRAP